MSLPCGCGRDEKKLKPDLMESLSIYDSVFIKYYQQLDESDGFDFDEYPGPCMFAPIYPILEFELFPKFVDRIKGYASLAIKQYFGNDGKERTVTKILKLNAGCPRDYITFKIDNEGKEEIFQANLQAQGEHWSPLLYHHIHNIQGFDHFDEYPGKCLFAPIYPIQHFGDDGNECNVTKILKLNAGCPRDFAY